MLPLLFHRKIVLDSSVRLPPASGTLRVLLPLRVLLLLVAVCAQPRLGRCVQILFNTQLDYDPPVVETPMRISFNFRLDGMLSRCTSRTKTSASKFTNVLDTVQ